MTNSGTTARYKAATVWHRLVGPWHSKGNGSDLDSLSLHISPQNEASHHVQFHQGANEKSCCSSWSFEKPQTTGALFEPRTPVNPKGGYFSRSPRCHSTLTASIRMSLRVGILSAESLGLSSISPGSHQFLIHFAFCGSCLTRSRSLLEEHSGSQPWRPNPSAHKPPHLELGQGTCFKNVKS